MDGKLEHGFNEWKNLRTCAEPGSINMGYAMHSSISQVQLIAARRRLHWMPHRMGMARILGKYARPPT